MKQTAYQKKRKEALKRDAFFLYKKGESTRRIGKKLGISHTTAWAYIKEKLGLSTIAP
jgi:hypothetical protein